MNESEVYKLFKKQEQKSFVSFWIGQAVDQVAKTGCQRRPHMVCEVTRLESENEPVEGGLLGVAYLLIIRRKAMLRCNEPRNEGCAGCKFACNSVDLSSIFIRSVLEIDDQEYELI